MNEEILNNIANRIEATGLKRDAKVTDLHHYAVAVEVTPKTYGEIVESMPDVLEYCFDYFDQKADKEESVFMFYLARRLANAQRRQYSKNRLAHGEFFGPP